MVKAQPKRKKLEKTRIDTRGKHPNSRANLLKGHLSPDTGRPVIERSITYWLKEFALMSPAEAARRCKIYAAQLKNGGDDLPIAGVIAIRSLMELMNDPDPRLFEQVTNRMEGKVPLPVEDWRSKLVNNGVNPDHILRGLVESVIAARAKRPDGGSLGDGAERIIESATSPSVAVESTISQS